MSYEFFDIDRLSIWEISRESYEQKKTWLSVMKDSKNERVAELAKFFIELGILSKTISLEIILDILIGSKDLELSTDENEDEYFNNSIPKLKSKFVSNYKNFYFGESAIRGDLASYIHCVNLKKVKS